MAAVLLAVADALRPDPHSVVYNSDVPDSWRVGYLQGAAGFALGLPSDAIAGDVADAVRALAGRLIHARAAASADAPPEGFLECEQCGRQNGAVVYVESAKANLCVLCDRSDDNDDECTFCAVGGDVVGERYWCDSCGRDARDDDGAF